MSSWLASSLNTGLQSTIGQIRTLTREIVDDIRSPLEDDEIKELKLKLEALEAECSDLRKQTYDSRLHDSKAVLEQLVEDVGLTLEGSLSDNGNETIAMADFIRSKLIDMNSKLTNLIDLDDNINNRISTLYENNVPPNDVSWTSLSQQIQRFPTYCKLFELLQHCMRDRNRAKTELAKSHSQIEYLSREVNRLKSHLLDIHEQHEEEIQGKVTSCNRLEEEVKSFRTQQIEDRKQIEKLTNEKNTLLDELRNCMEEAGRKERELSDKVNQQAQLCTNLHNALTNSHNETKQMVQSLRASHAAEIEALNNQLSTRRVTESESVTGNSVDRMRQEELEMTRMIKRLKMDLALKEEERKALAQTLRNISPSIGNRIEKSIARELLISFLRADPAKRIEAVRPLAQVLEFTEEQVEELTELQKESHGWFSGWTSRKPMKKSEETISLAELLIKYVDQETRPELRVRFNTTESNPNE